MVGGICPYSATGAVKWGRSQLTGRILVNSKWIVGKVRDSTEQTRSTWHNFQCKKNKRKNSKQNSTKCNKLEIKDCKCIVYGNYISLSLILIPSQKDPGAECPEKTVVIQERRLHVGVHNGWCFLDKPQVVVLEPVGVRGQTDSSSKKSTLFKDRWAERTHVRVYSRTVTVGCRGKWSIIPMSDEAHRRAVFFSCSAYFFLIWSGFPVSVCL